MLTPAPDTLASIDTAALAAGSYAFQATVAGDTNYLGATSACEPLTVVPPTGVLLPTQTTCEMYRDGQWPPMYDAFLYQVKAGMINSVSPGVIFYYNTITAPSANFTFTVVETNELKPAYWKAMFEQTIGQAILYNANCSKVSGVVVTHSGTTSPYTITFDVTGATPDATYYIGIKYSPQNLIGQGVGNSPWPTNTYSWSTYFGAVIQPGSTDSIPVAPKKPVFLLYRR